MTSIWWFIGVTAAIIFYGRFYLQWIVSEMRGESTIPIAFWYMSSVGSILLLGYAAHEQSVVGALSHSFNIIIYARNLIHIWRERGTLTCARRKFMNLTMIVVVLIAICVLGYTWYKEYVLLNAQPRETQQQTLLWIGVGVLGQLLFAARVTIQWIASEKLGKSVIPLSFWYLSIAATLMLVLSHYHQAEWVFFTGNVANVLIYTRNLWMIQVKGQAPVECSG